jgi:hypothetical protein
LIGKNKSFVVCQVGSGHFFSVWLWVVECALASQKEPNAQVNRQKCGAFLSVLNLQLGW